MFTLELSGQIRAPAALHPMPMDQAAGRAAEPVWMLWAGEEFRAPTHTWTG
jgi:hypothetical protein